MRKTFMASAVLAAALTLPAQAADYKVGLLLPYSGVYASLGNDITAGFNLAVEHFGKDLGDDSLTLVQEDTEVKPPVGLAKARKLVLQDKVDAISGIVSSGVLAALRDFVHQTETPLIVANAGNDQMTGERCSPYIIRVSFSNGQVNRPMGPWLVEKGVKKIYTLAPDYAAGHQMIEAFSKSFTEAGGEIVDGQFTPFRKTKDFGPYLTAAAASGADGIFVFYAGGEAIGFVKQYGEFGINEKMPLYGSGWLTSPLYVAAEGKAADGVITSLNYSPSIENPENERFQKDYMATHDRPASEYAVQGYDAGRLVIEAIKASGGDKDAFKKNLSKVKFSGPRGPLEIDPATNNIVQNIYIYETKVAEDGSTSQEILDVVEAVRDAPNGCQMN
ncbi:ABC transporter substrate-binding protein [Rhodobium gokarnense]|uniref:Branched-chain amino acid transport system substrate-binding protein n=1 Tax=Rhodobium gokarnense TaxID=364296 RepID=A0ABT3HBQ1_9HYPH|nr:ABC transporter substrate-binding protein [Rhodobium gokarnense]MCW2307828.1 branched-chain amino acid transport system substrate-binding protein [Rhodobium gokarnense]